MPGSELRKSYELNSAIIPILGLVICLCVFIALPPWQAVFASVLGCMMLAISYVDYRQYIIPDILSLPAIPLGLLATFVTSNALQPSLSVLEHLLAGAAAAGFLWAVRAVYARYRGIEGLGLGDVKLAAAAGAWIGPHNVSVVLVLACLGALVYLAWFKLRQPEHIGRMTVVPFGTFLAPAIWLVWTSQAIHAL